MHCFPNVAVLYFLANYTLCCISQKNRKEIPCYWENQAGGCQKFHCAFHHEKPRFIDGHFVAPDKGIKPIGHHLSHNLFFGFLTVNNAVRKQVISLRSYTRFAFNYYLTGPVVREEKEEETPKDDHLSSASANISNTTNPQLRGVIKVETQESVPSPTHPPVVINPVDDEDDEDGNMILICSSARHVLF